MGQIADTAKSVYRANEPGTTTPNKPSKSEIISLFGLVDDEIEQAAADIANALLSQDNIFSDTTAGLAGTEPGGFFFVPVDDGLELFKDNAGVAESKGVLPDTVYIDNALEQVDDALAQIDGLKLAAGDYLTDATPMTGQAFGGAVLNTVGGQTKGFTIPSGQTGIGAGGEATNIIPQLDVSAVSERLAGTAVHLRIVAEMTAGMQALIPLNQFELINTTDRDGSTHTGQGAHVSQAQDGSTYTRVLSYTFTGDEALLQPIIMVLNDGSPAVAPSDYTVTPIDAIIEIMTANTAYQGTPADLALDARLEQQAASGRAYVRIVTVGTTGADYTTMAAAYASFTGLAQNARGLVQVITDISEVNITPPDWVDTELVFVTITGELPDNVDLMGNNNPETNIIATTQTVFWNTNSNWFGVGTITGKNLRYPVHSDGSNLARFRNVVQSWKGIDVIHYGNAGATAVHGADKVWQNCDAFGCGTSSGMRRRVEYCYMQAPRFPYANHDNTGFEVPAMEVVRGCVMRSTNAEPLQRWCMALTSLGSGQASTIVFENNDTGGGRGIYMIANDGGEIAVLGSGNTPTPLTVVTGTSTFRTKFSDETTTGLNATGSSIPKGAVVTWDASSDNIRLMTAGDPVGTKAMVTMEAIANGAWGLLKKGGGVLLEDVLFDGVTPYPSYGGQFSISDTTPGRLVAGGSPVLSFFAMNGYWFAMKAPD